MDRTLTLPRQTVTAALPEHEQARHREIIEDNERSEADLLVRLRAFKQSLTVARQQFDDLQYGTRRGVHGR